MKRSILNRFAPRLVTLEDRLTPAGTITVSTTSDVVNGNTANIATLIANPGADGKISLREAVMAANGTASSGIDQATANVINLPNGTYTITGDYMEIAGVNAAIENRNTHIIGASRTGTILQTTNTSGLFATGNNGTQNRHLLLSHATVQNFSVTPIFIRGQSGNSATFDDVRFFNNQISSNGGNGGAIKVTAGGGFGASLTLTNCIFDSNKSNQGSGGAVAWMPQDPANIASLTVSGCTFTNNTAQGASGGGGAIYIVGTGFSPRPNISNSTFTGNTVTSASAEGGGALHSGNTWLILNRSSFTGNQVTAVTTPPFSGGGAVYAGDADVAITVNHNRFVNNTTAKTGDADEVYLPGGVASGNVNDNWWGQNSGPASNDLFNLPVTSWLQLRHAPAAAAILANGTTTLTADLLGRNTGTPIAASTLVGLPSIASNFTNATLGTLSGTTQFVNGIASATFKAGTTLGPGSAKSTADSQAVTATVTIGNLPAVTTSPGNQTLVNGSKATFTAAASGSPTPTVQWQLSVANGAFANISSATAASYTTPTIVAGDNGNRYRAVFTNALGSATSGNATLTVHVPPNLTQQPANQTVLAGATATFSAAYIPLANPTPTAQWQRSVAGGAFVNIAGATATSYTTPATTAADNGNRYQVIFTNSAGTSTTTPATMTVNFASSVTTQPANKSVTVGQTATFTAAATGNPAPTVQWRVSVGGAPYTDIIGATSPSFTTPPTVPSNHGNRYLAVFSNGIGSPATTSFATLTVAGVSGFTVNGGIAQRSRLTTIEVNFTTPVNAASYQALGAITLTRGSTVVYTGASGPYGRIVTAPASGMTSTLTLTFDNPGGNSLIAGVEHGSLADGYWQLRVPTLAYTSPLNSPTLRRLFGDVDANGTVNADDLAQFGNAFGGANLAFDFDANGTVDASDFSEFGNRFGFTL